MGSTFKKDGPFSKTFTFLRKRMYCTHHVDPLRDEKLKWEGEKREVLATACSVFRNFSMILHVFSFFLLGTDLKWICL
jgi:hypothetical protein